MLSDEQRALLADHNDRLLFDADGREIDVENEALFELAERIAADAARAAERALAERTSNLFATYAEEQHSDECGFGACVRCVVDEFAAALAAVRPDTEGAGQ